MFQEFFQKLFRFDVCPYDRLDPATLSFCEQQLCSFVRTPGNSFSCAAILVIGIWIIVRKAKPKIYRLFGWTTILLALFSFAAHASTSFFGQVLDIGSMYLFSALILTYTLQRKWPIGKLYSIMIYSFCVLFPLTLLILFQSHLGIIFFALELGLTFAVEISIKVERSKRSKRYLLLTVSMLALGFFGWCLDTFDIVCDPSNHFVSGHVIWHFFCAAAIVFLGEYILSLPVQSGRSSQN